MIWSISSGGKGGLGGGNDGTRRGSGEIDMRDLQRGLSINRELQIL